MLTETDLRKIEDRLVARLEKRFSKIFATKEELKATERYLEYKIDVVATDLREFKEEMYKFRDSVLKTLDWLVGAFQKFDQEYAISYMQHERITKTLDAHDERLIVCVTKLQIK